MHHAAQKSVEFDAAYPDAVEKDQEFAVDGIASVDKKPIPTVYDARYHTRKRKRSIPPHTHTT